MVQAHILQSPEWGEFRLKTPNVKKVLVVNGCQIFIHKVPFLPRTVTYLPRPEDLNNLGEIIEACKREKAIFLKIEPGLGSRGQVLGSRIGTPVLPQHTIYVDLSQSEEDLLANMHEKTRYNIGLAQKKGVKITEGENLENFIELLERTEDRQGFYSHPAQYYRTLWETMRQKKMAYLLSAYLPNNLSTSPIASIVLLRYQDVLYYAYGGSDPKYRQYMAPHLLHWEAIKLGKKLGCKIYDFWGSYKNSPIESDPWWGIYRFKKGFGGREITFSPTVDVPLSPLYPLYPLADSLRRKFKKLFS